MTTRAPESPDELVIYCTQDEKQGIEADLDHPLRMFCKELVFVVVPPGDSRVTYSEQRISKFLNG